MTPPAVIKLMSQVKTWAEPLETERKLRKGKTIVTAKQKIGTPFFVHFLKSAGARPSMARPYMVLSEITYVSIRCSKAVHMEECSMV